MSQPVSDATDALPELHGGRHVGPHGGRHIQRQARGRGGDDTTHEAPAQVRQTRKDGWSAQRQAQFLEALEDSFNVAQAARDVGMSVQSAYKLRQRDPGFAQGWAEALERGYAELEMLLLRRSVDAQGKSRAWINGSVATVAQLRDQYGVEPVAFRPVTLLPQVVRLRPAPHCRSRILSYSLRVEPAPHFVNWQQDPFSNHLARLVFPEKTTEFKVTVDLVAEMSVYNPFDFFLEPSAENYPFQYERLLSQELAPYLAADPLTPGKLLVRAVGVRDPGPGLDQLCAEAAIQAATALRAALGETPDARAAAVVAGVGASSIGAPGTMSPAKASASGVFSADFVR